MSKDKDQFAFLASRRAGGDRGGPAGAGPPKMPPSPLWGLLAWAAVVAGLAGLVYLGFRLWESSAPGEVAVPDVVGVNVDAAQSMLKRKRLASEISSYRPSDEVPKDHIVAAYPKPGEMVKQGRVVRLVVSTGKGWLTMPDLREMPAERAGAICQEEGLKPTRRRFEYSDAPQGYVIGQVPIGGSQVRVGAQVTLVVSRGPAAEVKFEEGRHYADVTVSLPAGGERRHVEIVLVDNTGANVAYSQWCEPGTTVVERVWGRGMAVAVRVYVDGELIKERTLQ